MFVLEDNHPITLSAKNVDPDTVVVVDSSNVTSSPFVATTDYTLDTSALSTTGVVTVARAMQTTIADLETVVVYFENSASANQGNSKTDLVILAGTTPVTPTDAAAGTQAASILVEKQGQLPTSDFTISGAGTGSVTLVWKNTAVTTGKFQTVYVDYTDGSGNPQTNYEVQLNNLSTVALPADSTAHTVKNATTADTTVTAAAYQKGTTTDLDYIITGSGGSTAISRSAGSTTMGVSTDALQVKVTYTATPFDYWLPTRCFSQNDVENKFGPAFDNSGNILNPVSYAALLAFQNGAPTVIVQALFSINDFSQNANPTGTLEDWQNTLVTLYDIEDLNVIVPVIATTNLVTSPTDGLNLSILQAVQDYLNYMQLQNEQYIIAITGEDSTVSGLASKTTLRSHAQSLAAGAPSESVVLVSPGSYQVANPVTGSLFNIGGQYAAACVAGMLGRYSIQAPLTRQQVASILALGESRSRQDQNADGAAGLLVIATQRNNPSNIQVRHAITVDRTTADHSELSVVRSKYYMLSILAQTLDQGVIGQIVIDQNATFRIQLVVENVLDALLQQGVIFGYDTVQCRIDPNSPTTIDVQFSYTPNYPLNNISISFSVNQSTGVVFSTTASSTSGVSS